jgi:PAS domain S-box-containing protein
VRISIVSSLDDVRAVQHQTIFEEHGQARGLVQAHGIVAVVSTGSLKIECISENVDTLLGIPAADLCDMPITAVLDGHDAENFATKLREPRLAALNPHDITLRRPDGTRLRVEAAIRRGADGRVVIELEPREPTVEPPSFGEAQAPIERLAKAVSISALLAGAARDVRAISGFDCVMIYRFAGDSHCDVVAEAAAPGTTPNFLGRHFPATHIPEQMRRQHLADGLKIVPDVQAAPARLISSLTRTPAPVDLSRSALCNASPEQLDYLTKMGSRAALTIGIVIRGRLWGLIACHHDEPRRLSYRKRAVCELLGHMLAWQLDARLEAEKLRERSRVATLQANIGATLDAADDIGRAATEAGRDILDLFDAQALAVNLDARIRRTVGAPSDDAQISATAARLNALAENGAAAIGDVLFIRLAPDGSDYILVFRSRADRAWTSDDLNAAQTLRGTFIALLQTRERQRNVQLPRVDLYLAARNAQAAALIKLHDDIAAAIPARHAIIKVILDFAQSQTRADGCALGTLGTTDIGYEAATGILAPSMGQRVVRAGSLAGKSADRHEALVCDDCAHDLTDPERDERVRLGVASLAVVPIVLSETATVVLEVVSTKRKAFGDEDIQTLKLAATNLLTALRSAQKFAALAAAESEQRTYARQLRALHAIASTTTSNRRDQIDAALGLGLVQLDLDWAFLGAIDYDAQQFVIENSVSRQGGIIIEAGVRMPLNETLMGRSLHTRGVRIVQDASLLDESPGLGGAASFIVAPLFIEDVNYGAIGFISHEVRAQPFSEANVEFVAVAGELIASAVERGLQRERLETSETRYRALTESIPEMVWVVDAKNRFEYVNARWTNYTGLTLAQSRALGQHGFFDADDMPVIDSRRAAVPPTEFDCEVRLRRRDGVFRWHLVRSVPFHDAAGDAGKWLITATDIEARKSAETLMSDVHEAALAATQAKSRFLATMSHEIRTPMNAVIGMTELLLLTQLSDEQREYIEIVRDSGQSLLRVLNDILDYSKIEAGKLALETVHFDLAGQIDSVVELLRAQYQLKGVRLTTRINPDVPAVVAGDPGRLRQILLNLAGNALKFTPEGGAVHIDVVTDPDPAEVDAVPIRFTIEDTGIGIPARTVERLFQPFSQGDESTTRKYGGTGLGLSICAQLVALMNGNIGVRSTPGSGSAFWFSIPLRAVKHASKAHDPRKRGAVRPKPVVMRAEKILLVEDNEINTFLALKQLQRIGFIVSAVNNGAQAVEAVSHERFDLVFMDCHMPEMDGFAATREIRRMEAGGSRHLPIVAMTADARTEDHQNCLRAGMDDYVSKPTSIDSLRAVLDRWLPTPDRRQNSRSAIARTGTARTFAVAKLLELCGDDRDAVITLLTAAAGSIKADVARIENCAAAHEYAAVAEAAHRLKGTSASIRSPRLGEISAKVEAAALAATTTSPLAPALLAELRSAVDALIDDVEKHGKLLATIS